MKQLKGVIPAIPTPLQENEDVDTVALKKLVDYVIDTGVSGIFVLGNMGEGAAIVDSQRLVAVEKAVEYVDSRVPVLAGIGDTSTRRMIERGKEVAACGPDYLVFTTPFYYSFSHPDSLYESAERISNSLDCPCVFYHCPGTTGNKASAETVLKIMELPNVKAVKDSSCDFSLFAELLRSHPDREKRDCAILQGHESVYDISLLNGADGVITGGGTVFLDTLLSLYDSARKGDKTAAFEYQQQFSAKMNDMLGPEKIIDWVYAVKLALSKKGLCSPNVTSPFLKRIRG